MAQELFDEMTEAAGGLSPLEAPIPGESLTSDPDQRPPFERPPEFVDEEEAVRDIFMNLTDEDKVDDVLDVLRMGTPVEDIAQTILFEGFRQGKYTPDLMLMLTEPTIYLIMAVAETAGIDYEIYPEEDFWGDDVDHVVQEKEIEALKRTLSAESPSVDQTGEEGSIENEISSKDLPKSVTPSMLEQIKGMNIKNTTEEGMVNG